MFTVVDDNVQSNILIEANAKGSVNILMLFKYNLQQSRYNWKCVCLFLYSLTMRKMSSFQFKCLHCAISFIIPAVAYLF